MKLEDLTPSLREKLAKKIPMGADSLRQVASGRRRASAKTAIKIELAARKMGLEIRRESLCDGCNGCEFAKAARKGKS